MDSPPTQTPVVFQSMSPILAARDLQEAVAYYRDTLGFALAWTWGAPPVRAGVIRDGLELQLVSDGRGAPPGPSRVYFLLTAVDDYYQRCCQHGGNIVMALADRPFGVRDFRVADPTGNVICFGQSTGAR